MKKIKVLIVDDSALVRQTLKTILETDKKIKVIATASDPFIAAKKIQKEDPDVITLDIEMPKMDGLTFLKKLMSQYPIPVVIISSLSGNNTTTGLRALEYGAVEIITKPKLSSREFYEESKIMICDVVKAAAIAKIKRKIIPKKIHVKPKLSADVVLKKSSKDNFIKTTEHVIVVGASTGGTDAISLFLESLPVNSPGIVIVQHMPELFTRSFADRLNNFCKIMVKEAENNDTVIRGRALIAPGNHHLLLKRSGTRYYVEINNGPLVNRHRPSVDVLFRSAAKNAGKNTIDVIMTGMGADGAQGLLELHEAGAKTIAQDEKSCVVFGMPKEAIKLNAAQKILFIDQIYKHVLENY